MEAFICCGSKGGAGRTASSVILATGLAKIGLRPLHLQLAGSGGPPVVATAEGVPFSAAWFPEEQATRATIQQIIAAHPQCASIVIDTPKKWAVRGNLLPDLSAVVLLFPMRRTSYEIEVAVRNYRDFQSQLNAVNGPDDMPPNRRYSEWLLPVGWPLSHPVGDFASIVARFDTSLRSGSPPPSILVPGIPEIPRDDLDDLINGTSFQCSSMISDVSVSIARAAMKLTGKSQQFNEVHTSGFD